MQIIDIRRNLDDAGALGLALSELVDADTTYVFAPDGTPIDGFRIVEETLTDGSKVQNVYLLAQKAEAR